MKRDCVLVLTYEVGVVGGIQRYTRDMASALAENGYHVNILAKNPNSTTAPFYSLCAVPRHWSRFWMRWLRRRADRILCDSDTVLIVAAHAGLGDLAHQLASKFSVPYVVCTYGIEVWGRWDQPVACGLTNAYKVWTISQFTDGKLRQRGLEKISILPVTIDTDRYALPARESKKGGVILTVARLAGAEGYKGHDFVIRCLPKLIDRFPKLEYHIVGTGDNQARLQRYAASLGMRDRVVFLGGLSEEELIAEYHRADVFVMLSETGQKEDGTWMGEGFGRVYLEAAACGCPVIAADGGGASEAFIDGESGYLIKARDEPAFLRSITDLLCDEKLRLAMGMAGRRFVETHFASNALRSQINAQMDELQKSNAN